MRCGHTWTARILADARAKTRRLGLAAFSSVLIAGFSSAPVASAKGFEGGQSIYGWTEYAHLYPKGLRLKAKLDTGANTSSLNALNMEKFERDGEPWIKFEVIDPSGDERIRFERPISREVHIKDLDGGSDSRPVVRMELCIGRTYREVEFSLVDRSHFDYQVLVGRNFLADAVLVDAGKRFLAGKKCKAARKQ
ncbi:MAG TPA: RimK/LysX family protein [Polyangiales bacterium]|nr:RimK/LysX family protein [Polyangiales bacterium]